MLGFLKNDTTSASKNWHIVRSGIDKDGKPLTEVKDLKPIPLPKIKPGKFPPGTVFISLHSELQSKFMVELNARFIFFNQEFTPEISLQYDKKTYIAIEPRNKFYMVLPENVPYGADLWTFDDEESIPDVMDMLWNNYISKTPLQIRIDTYSQIIPAGFNIFHDKIMFFNGKEYSTQIDTDVFEYLANFYDNLFISNDSKLVIKTLSKQTIYLEGVAIGALLLEDVMMINYLYKALKLEKECLENNIIPDYTELHQNIDTYIAKWTNFLPKRLNSLMEHFNNHFLHYAIANQIKNVKKPMTVNKMKQSQNIWIDDNGQYIDFSKVDTNPVLL